MKSDVTGLVWPNALTLDYDNQILYWMDANRLESSNADGSNRRFLSTTRIFHPFGITFFQNRLYWTDWTLNSVLSAPVNRPTAVSVVISNLRLDPMGISVVSVERQPAGLLLWYPDRIMMVSTYIIHNIVYVHVYRNEIRCVCVQVIFVQFSLKFVFHYVL